MKKIGVLAVVMAMAFLLAGVANAEMYVEGYLGAAQAATISNTFTAHEIPSLGGATGISDFHLSTEGKTGPQVLGGIKVGTWFVKEGFAGFNYPDWMKYFGFYTDFSFQNLNMNSQTITGVDTIQATGTVFSPLLGKISTQGTVATWAFMFAARYGFYPDSEVPFGRLQPYVAVGPAIMFSSMKPKIQAFATNFAVFPDFQNSPGNQGSTNIALAVDGGVRFMALKNVSIDVSFKYRYANPSYSFAGVNFPVDNRVAVYTLSPTYHLFSGQVGVAYHF